MHERLDFCSVINLNAIQRMPRVFGIGNPLMDVVIKCESSKLAKLGLTRGSSTRFEMGKLDCLVEEMRGSIVSKKLGDRVRNTLEGVSKLGGRTAYCGLVGANGESKEFKNALARTGITPVLVNQANCRIGKVLVFVDEAQERSFAVNMGDTMQISRADLNQHLRVLNSSSTLLISSSNACSSEPISEAIASAAEHAKNKQLKVAFAVENIGDLGKKRACVSKFASTYADILFLNESEASELTGERNAMKALSKLKTISPVVVMTRGANGAVIWDGKREVSVLATQAKAVDTTGAGDYFASGILFGLSQNLPMRELGGIASALAAHVVTFLGASFIELTRAKVKAGF
ncbi:MAG: adenosine kinase [Candidatus Micrarchaeota archaeon]